MNGPHLRDRAILIEQGTHLLTGEEEWYVRFGRRQSMADWLNQHTREQVVEMYATTAAHEGIPLRILELFPIVEPKKVRVGRVYFPVDLQEQDVATLRNYLDVQAKGYGLEIEPESIALEVRVDSAQGIFVSFTALAR